MGTPARASADRRWVEYAILVVATLAALELKRPFGLLANQVLNGQAPAAGASPYVLSLGEWLQLAAVLLACFVHPGTDLPAAPWLEKLLRMQPRSERTRLWRPALIAILATLAYTTVYSAVVSRLGLTSKLVSQLRAPTLPAPILVKMALLYPFAALGAAASEELVYRFALITLIAGLIWLALPVLKARRRFVLGFAIVVSGLYFGYVHVAENLETVRTGNFALDVLTTPQTFAGIAFGCVFCAYGLEAAMVAHALSDLLAPILLKLL
jgi:membrane protease YdiL (CAAX protease family)